MKTFNVEIQGIFDLLQHRFPDEKPETGGKKPAVGKDYSEEWRQSLYLTDDKVYQPADHMHASLVKAATGMKISGGGNKTYKALFQASIYIEPSYLFHQVTLADFNNAQFETGPVLDNYLHPVYIDRRPVVVRPARVMRYRPAIVKGWRLNFVLKCFEDELPDNTINQVLSKAGSDIGIGDYRPRFGRFMITKFERIED